MSHIGYVNRPPPWPLWSPLFLFASGAQRAWYDPSDLSTLFQDSTGTIPVTGLDQPVGLMRDKSGNNNHMRQSVASARPVLKTTTGNNFYLEFDGVDDSLSLSAMWSNRPSIVTRKIRWHTELIRTWRHLAELWRTLINYLIDLLRS